MTYRSILREHRQQRSEFFLADWHTRVCTVLLHVALTVSRIYFKVHVHVSVWSGRAIAL